MTGKTQHANVRRPVIALVSCLLSGGAFGAPQPIMNLPLQAEGEQHWRLPAGHYQGSFSIDQPMTLTCAPEAVFEAQGEGNGLIIRAPNVQVRAAPSWTGATTSRP